MTIGRVIRTDRTSSRRPVPEPLDQAIKGKFASKATPKGSGKGKDPPPLPPQRCHTFHRGPVLQAAMYRLPFDEGVSE